MVGGESERGIAREREEGAVPVREDRWEMTGARQLERAPVQVDCDEEHRRHLLGGEPGEYAVHPREHRAEPPPIVSEARTAIRSCPITLAAWSP